MNDNQELLKNPIPKTINLNKYTIKPNKKSMKELCIPKKFKLQISQKFLAEFFKKSDL